MDYSVADKRRSSADVGNASGICLKGNRYFGDKEVQIWENLLDHKPQNLHYRLSCVLKSG